ncbi:MULTISPECIES: hypothetical protein [Bacillaceae]|uniref:hypothetical protein n=1 Tax=Bacillaceae TaxID=186817 RepID=UPI001BDF6CA7|nr:MULTISPECIES: hypothetical protein [Bacillaceae]MDX8359944.1 hypothetical protein [Cytobacillus sp. IB215316]
MKSLQDALYNWLSIKVVADSRKNDSAAQDTYALFTNILVDEHGLSNISVTKDEIMYYISYSQNGSDFKNRFPIELIHVMLDQIELEPEKYINYPNE